MAHELNYYLRGMALRGTFANIRKELCDYASETGKSPEFWYIFTNPPFTTRLRFDAGVEEIDSISLCFQANHDLDFKQLPAGLLRLMSENGFEMLSGENPRRELMMTEKR